MDMPNPPLHFSGYREDQFYYTQQSCKSLCLTTIKPQTPFHEDWPNTHQNSLCICPHCTDQQETQMPGNGSASSVAYLRYSVPVGWPQHWDLQWLTCDTVSQWVGLSAGTGAELGSASSPASRDQPLLRAAIFRAESSKETPSSNQFCGAGYSWLMQKDKMHSPATRRQDSQA